MARWMRLSWKWPEQVRRKQVSAFHANPWAHLRLDQTTGQFIERENPFPTPESLYQLCDAEFVYQTFGQDEVVQLECLRQGGQVEDTQSLESLAEILEVAVDFQTPDAARKSAHILFDTYALRATMFTVELATQLLQECGKQLLILLSYGFRNVEQAILGEPRFDGALIEFLQEKGLRYVDTMRSHVEDARAFRLNAQEYCQRYYIDGYGGHYSPAGNHFFAFAVKDALVEWLEPKPITYQASDQAFMKLGSISTDTKQGE